jgi:5'-3' exonuclease
MNLEQYKGLRDQIVDLRKQMQVDAKQILQDGLREIFDQFPEVESIGWKQYTPYFNDGDECIFRCYADEPDINGNCGWELSYHEETELLAPAQKAASKILEVIEDEDYKIMFGDHALITIHRDGTIDVEEYVHD